MENQHVSVLRMKNRKALTVLCTALCLLLSPFLLVVMCLPQAMGIIPVLLMAMLGYIGPVSALTCSLVMAGMTGWLFGGWGFAVVLLFFLPVLIAAALQIERNQPFWLGAAATGVTQFASMGVIVTMLSLVSGTDVVSAISQMIREAFTTSGMLGDSMLMMLAQAGVLQLENGVPQIAQITGLLPDATREILLGQMIRIMDATLRLELPMQMATGAVSAGVLGQAVLRKGIRRRGMKVDYPPLRTWRVPKGWGRVLGLTLVAFYVLTLLAPNMASSSFYVFSGVIEQIFALQGIAALSYLLHKHGAKRIWHGVLFIGGYFFMKPAMDILGVLEQVTDFTHRREAFAESENPFDPRTGGEK